MSELPEKRYLKAGFKVPFVRYKSFEMHNSRSTNMQGLYHEKDNKTKLKLLIKAELKVIKKCLTVLEYLML